MTAQHQRPLAHPPPILGQHAMIGFPANLLFASSFLRNPLGVVAGTIAAWPDVTVYTRDAQAKLLVHGMIDKARRQICLFTVLRLA